MQVDLPTFDGLYQSSLAHGCGPYEPSIASSASSSQASIFSDVASVQSSIASSVSDDFRLNQEDTRDRAYAQAQILQKAALESCNAPAPQCIPAGIFHGACPPPPSYADVTSVPKQHRQHPRRSSLSRHQRPPTLQRQCDRKTNFVESLVDSATQMVEVIWPLSVVPCKSEGSSEKSVLPLRSYIEETLRRSKTSYSTLQVALYYLVLIKPFVPRRDFTQEQRMDCPASRALMCGRRMFLAALILASKYLQDRNYSAKAWSKMSGLKVCEINSNERTFLSKVNWKLHIAESVFKTWTDIVLDFTPNTQPPSPGQSIGLMPPTWKAIIPLLTPELDKVPVLGLKHKRSLQCMGNYGTSTPTTPTPTKPTSSLTQLGSMSSESTPTPMTSIPRFLEPKFDMEPPVLPRMGPLPTPQMTPSSVAASTPAVSACGSRRPSICSAMAMVQKSGFNRCTMDAFPFPGKDTFQPFSRRPSITSASSRSSPESMMSDRSRSSRASSISSVSTVSTTSSMAPNRACHLARQATCRNARLPLLPPATVVEEKEKEGSATKPIIIADTDDVELVSSPDMVDFSISEKVLTRPDRHSKHAPHHHHHHHHLTAVAAVSAAAGDKGRKRCRPSSSRGNRRSNLQEEVRWMLEEAEDDVMDIDDATDDDVGLSPAAEYASRMLARSGSARRTCAKQVQPPAALSRSGSCRMPVRSRQEGKRTCCSTSVGAGAGAMEIDVSPCLLYGEVA